MTADRNFDSSTSTRGPSGGYTLLKPDIVVINRVDQHNELKTPEDRIHWRNVYAFVEVTSLKRNGLKHILTQISQKAACIFDVQPQRKFVCALGILGTSLDNLKFTLAVVDRAGFTYTEPASIKGYPAMEFLRVIFSFCFTNTETIGWDPTMNIDPKTHEVLSITVTGPDCKSGVLVTQKFFVVKLIHNSPILFGRGTRVWIVKDEKDVFYILKDSWILHSNNASEIALIKHVEKTIEQDPDGPLFKHICPRYYIGQDTVNSTNVIRGAKIDSFGTRCQRRIVTGPIGDPITSFRSKVEFVTTCLDLVNGMYLNFPFDVRNAQLSLSVLDFLDKKAKVIHGDLSINNIMINRVWDHGEKDLPSQLRTRAFAGAYKPDINLVSPLPQAKSCESVPFKVDNDGTTEPIESCGMIIDCDFMRHKGHSSHQTSVSIYWY